MFLQVAFARTDTPPRLIAFDEKVFFNFYFLEHPIEILKTISSFNLLLRI